MTLLDNRPATEEDLDLTALAGSGNQESSTAAAETEPEDERPPVSLTQGALAAGLTCAGAGWMLGGVFESYQARAYAALAAVLGAGIVALSGRLRAPAILQSLGPILGLAAGAAVALPDTGSGGASLPTLVLDSVRNGGLASPPVPFDPGWRIILVFFICTLAVASSTAAVALRRTQLTALLPAPVVILGVLLQPAGGEVASVIPALILFSGGLATAYGAELSRSGETGARFEGRRLLKAGGMLAGAAALLLAVTQLGFLFPAQSSSQAIPPKKPQNSPVEADHEIFTVTSSEVVPWRLGSLDVYADNAWETAEFDPATLRSPGSNGALPFDTNTSGPTIAATFRIDNLPGRDIPTLISAAGIQGKPSGLTYDPVTQNLRAAGQVKGGTTYTVTAAAPPDASTLTAAKDLSVNTPADLVPYLSAPAMPPRFGI